MNRVCLDSWAVLRWLEGAQPVASLVEDILGTRPVMSWINIGEVAYVVQRAGGESTARTVVGRLTPLVDADAVTRERVLAAASIKAMHAMAYADAFAVATALAHGAVLWTGDPEIVEADTGCAVTDLRSA